MNKFLNTMEKIIEKAIKEDAKRVIKEIGNEHIYAVALVMDNDCISVYMVLFGKLDDAFNVTLNATILC